MTTEEKDEPRCLGVFIFEQMKLFENNVMQIDAVTGKKETYRELRLRSIKVAQHMQARGLTSNDLISICTMNNMDCYVPYIAALFLGIKVAPFDPMLSIRECVYMIQLTEPKIIFCDEESVNLMEESIIQSKVPVDIVVFGETNVHIPFANFLKCTGIEAHFVPKTMNIQETALILFTSGSTGLAKGVCLTHFGLLHKPLIDIKPLICLQVTRLYWISATMFFIMYLRNGACSILVKTFDPKKIFKYLHDYKVKMLFLSPYNIYQFIEHLEYNLYDTSCLKSIITGGAIIRATQILKLRQIFSQVIVFYLYGMTETATAGTRFNPNLDQHIIETKPTSVGRKVEGIKYKILRMETNDEAGAYQLGELYIKTPTIMNGYYKNPEETAKAFDNDGYYKTGDIVYYDEDDCFFVVNRKKDLMKYRSMQINPGELENILLQHPDVLEAIVVSLPDEADGDHPMGIVMVKEGSKCSKDAIMKFVDDQVPDYKRLRGGIKIVKEIPLTPTGKFKRSDVLSTVIGNEF